MIWNYEGLTEFTPIVVAYRADIVARRAKARTGEQQQAIETELDDLAETLEAAYQLALDMADPRDVLKPLLLSGKVRDGFYFLHKPMNGCNIVYLRDVLKTSALPIFIYNVEQQRTDQAQRLLKFVEAIEKANRAGESKP